MHQLQRENEDLFQKVEVPSMRPRCMAHIDIVGISIVVTFLIRSFAMVDVLFYSAKSKIRMVHRLFPCFLISEGRCLTKCSSLLQNNIPFLVMISIRPSCFFDQPTYDVTIDDGLSLNIQVIHNIMHSYNFRRNR